MVGDQSANYLDEFDKVDLIVVGRLTRVLPDQQAVAVGQPFAGAVPAHEFIRTPPSAFGEKSAQLVMAAQHAVLLVIEDGRHKRAFEDGVFPYRGRAGPRYRALWRVRATRDRPARNRPGSCSPSPRSVVHPFLASLRFAGVQLMCWTASDGSEMMEVCVPP